MTRKTLIVNTLLLLAGLAGTACENTNNTADTGSIAAAEISLALTADPHDVTGFLYQIDCDNGFSATEYVPLQDGFMPTWVDSDAGDFHYFADLFSVTGVGHCKVTATPMQNPTTPSAECGPVSAEFDVLPGQTTEIVLMSQCKGDPTGAADIIAGLNDPPVILDLTMDPDKFICLYGQDEGKLGLSVLAEDPNGDALTYAWAVTAWPEMPGAGTYTIIPTNQPNVTFFTNTEGQYEVTVTVTDTYGASTSLSFPVHVQDCTVCCYIREKDVYLTLNSTEECERTHGTIVAHELCEPVEICCKLPDGTFDTISEEACKEQGGGATEETKLCEEVCCYNEKFDLDVFMIYGECLNTGGVAADPKVCTPELCCVFKDGSSAYIPAGDCKEKGGWEGTLEQCKLSCCYVEKYDLYVATNSAVCKRWAGQIVAAERCDETPNADVAFEAVAMPEVLIRK